MRTAGQSTGPSTATVFCQSCRGNGQAATSAAGTGRDRAMKESCLARTAAVTARLEPTPAA